MQLRTLLGQKQHNGIWIASLILVCISIIAHFILAYILVILGKGDIQNPEKTTKLEKYNNIALFITILISMINVIINAFMTTNPNTYFDISLLKSSTNITK
jgi:heme/copper-type cytochrome/quinol oxidase subunit 2